MTLCTFSVGRRSSPFVGPLFQHGKSFLFLLPSVDRIDTVQRGFNGLRLFGEVDRLLE